MAIKIKSAAEIARKWGEVTPGRSAYYEAGVKGAGSDWEAGSKAAAAAFKAAVSAGNIQQLFAGGVAKAGGAKYERKTLSVGVNRFGPGVSAGQPDMESGMGPMVETIAGLTLTARAPRGDAANQRRSVDVQVALHKKRLSVKGAGG